MYVLLASIELLLFDDEPLWEPLEWTFAQSFCLYLFLFSWIAETLISSKYGSFTGRDKRVYLGLYRSLWYVEIYFMFNLFIVSLFVIVPFYFEVTYPVSYIVSWWDFIDLNFLAKISFILWLVSYVGLSLQLSNRWANWELTFGLSTLITILIFYLFVVYSFNFFFIFFTDILWFKKSGWLDFQALSNGLTKWGWGNETRDHFSYHKTTTSFWYKNDSTFASAFFLIQFFIFISLMFLSLQWTMVIRSLWANKDVSYTSLNYAINSIVQFYYSYLFIYTFTVMSVIYQLSRIAVDSTWESFLYDLLTLSILFIKSNLSI